MNKPILHAEWHDHMCCYRLYSPEEPYRTVGFEDEQTLYSQADQYDIKVIWSHEEDIRNRLALTFETIANAKKKLDAYPCSTMYKDILNRATETEQLLRKELDALSVRKFPTEPPFNYCGEEPIE